LLQRELGVTGFRRVVVAHPGTNLLKRYLANLQACLFHAELAQDDFERDYWVRSFAFHHDALEPTYRRERVVYDFEETREQYWRALTEINHYIETGYAPDIEKELDPTVTHHQYFLLILNGMI